MAKTAGKVDTATLIRGRTYSMRRGNVSHQFIRDIPKVIDDSDFLEVLENEHDLIYDGDGEEFEKPRFRIDRNVDPPEGDGQRKPIRLSSIRKVKTRRRLVSS